MRSVVVLDNTSFEDKNYHILKHVNELSEGLGEISVISLNISNRLMNIETSVVNISELNNSYGCNIIATCLGTGTILGIAPVNANKYLFLHDLSFLQSAYSFDEVFNIFSEVNLITRSVEHHDTILKIFGIESRIQQYLDMSQL